jgi:hypothetical protein
MIFQPSHDLITKCLEEEEEEEEGRWGFALWRICLSSATS